ncbi:2-hydroxyacid dehydrogenase [Candidatus Nitrospira nitrificans]|uniref:2-oxo-carboxylic acid reductase (Glyoxalate reductase) (2-ketoaldonate reductase) n=1 Tax=Candidatus Nitrospira nitrificans TaxID=1742973 RepID=A0A0S4LN41_9BACT|nr:D-glycerate dehydrogenase [Candidatus Nitrospira nitrificans]CUS38993.1 2-oxo-carboxylic acid reductase (glyoxalate reductase) (2-ketoaldonate reductase) [Candidatus Nitrospira nitrificans]
MDRPILYITRLLPQPVLDAIPRHYLRLTEPTDRTPTAEELRRGFAEADAVISTLTDRIDASLLAHAKNLKVIANYAVGYNNIDVSAATRRSIIVTNTPDVLTNATADLTWALLLAVSRRVVEGDSWIRTGDWPGWTPTQLLGADVSGKTLGIVGMGRIGQAVAQRASGFRMSVIYAGRHPIPTSSGLAWTWQPLDEVLVNSDFLSLHVPLTDTTRHLIGRREITLMKPTAYLINTSRGPVIDEAALVSALEAKTIAGAGLDVYEQEPMVPAGLTALPNVVLLPHLGSATLEARVRMGLMCLDNIAAVLGGRLTPNRVN